MRHSLLARTVMMIFTTRRRLQHAPLLGGPADGLVLAVARPAPPWVFAALRPMVDGAVLLATASDEMAIYVSALGDGEGIERYRRADGPAWGPARYVHVSDRSDTGVPSP